VLFAWLLKLLRVAIPGGVNDPNVPSLSPFEVSGDFTSPVDPAAKLPPLVDDLRRAGFRDDTSIRYEILDVVSTNLQWTVAMLHRDGTTIGRAVLRREGTAFPRTHAHCDLITRLADGRFIYTTGASSWLDRRDPVVQVAIPKAGAAELFDRHRQAIAASGSTALPLRSIDDARQVQEAFHQCCIAELMRRGVHRPYREHEQAQADMMRSAALAATTAGQAAPAPAVAAPAGVSLESSIGAPFDPSTPPPLAAPAGAPPVDPTLIPAVAELERIQSRRAGALAGWALLGVTLFLFIVTARSGMGFDWKFALMLIPVLFIHELGHFLAMRVFRYRNVRMFFVPMLGAAVVGQNYNVPAWKKLIVYLAGPVPGIIIGAILGVTGLILRSPLTIEFAMAFVLLNGLNLLPILPLDGGHVVHLLFFSRHPILDVVFRVAAACCLLALGTLAGAGTAFIALGVVLLIGAPMSYQLASLVRKLRREGVAAHAEDVEKVPVPTALTIMGRLRSESRLFAKASPPTLARSCLQVFESLNTRPLSFLGTAGFTVVHLGAIVATVVFGSLFVIGRGGDLARALAMQMALPRTPLNLREVQTASAGTPIVQPIFNFGDFAEMDIDEVESASTQPTTEPTGGSALANLRRADVVRHVVARFGSDRAAREAWTSISTTLAPGESAARVGRHVFITCTGTDRQVGGAWARRMDSAGASRVDVASRMMSLSISCAAPSADKADRIRAQLESVGVLASTSYLIPPWTPAAADPRRADVRASQQHVRKTLVDVQSALTRAISEDPDTKRLRAAERKATQFGDDAEAKRLAAEIHRRAVAARDQSVEALCAKPGVDAALVRTFAARYRELNQLDVDYAALADEEGDDIADAGTPTTNPVREAERERAYKDRMKARMQEQRRLRQAYDEFVNPLAGVWPDELRKDVAPLYAGSANPLETDPPLIALYAHFNAPTVGLPALLQWLESEGCSDFHFDSDLSMQQFGLPDSGD
jgi:Zn-dependent protease